jgi:hypothetical protein
MVEAKMALVLDIEGLEVRASGGDQPPCIYENELPQSWKRVGEYPRGKGLEWRLVLIYGIERAGHPRQPF